MAKFVKNTIKLAQAPGIYKWGGHMKRWGYVSHVLCRKIIIPGTSIQNPEILTLLIDHLPTIPEKCLYTKL